MTRLFLGNIEAAGVIITLTAASNVGMVELPWTPGKLVQAEDRVYGRANDPHGANIWFPIAQGTIEEDIAEMLDKKAETFANVMDGADLDETEMLTELMKKLEE